MTRRFVNQLADAEDLTEVFRVSEKQLRPNRNGNLYLQVRLSDRTGVVTGMMWNANEKLYRSFENGDYVRVDGAAQLYNGTIQVIINQIRKANADDVDEGDFDPLTQADTERLRSRAAELLRGMRSVHLRNLAEVFLLDEEFLAKFCRAPAGVKIHHAYHGGLLQHVVGLMELAHQVAPLYPKLDPDLLLIGAFVHDVGKIDELSYERDLSYSDEGQLIGHMVQGVGLIDRMVVKAEDLAGEPIPADLVLRVKHMIVSHHGSLEFGSPRVPMTLEAVALHYLDSLDSKIHSFHQLMATDVNSDSAWTPYQPSIGRKLFKGGGQTP